jgi:large subunit ribosomal protein L3
MIGGLLGKKIGMTQVWDEAQVVRAATVLQVGPCTVLQVKSQDSDGYTALQLGFEKRRATERRGASRAEIGHARKAGTAPKRFVREVSVEPGHDYKPGQELTVELFNEVERVDVIGVTKGKGFQGTIKRHGHSRGPESHGSMNVREPGSIGQSSSPSRVFPGTRMPGHMGHARHTEHGLRVLRVEPERHLLIVGGAVPGPSGGYVMIRPARRTASRTAAS